MTHTKALHVGLVLAGVLAGIALSPFVNIHSCWGLLHYPSSPVSTNDLPTTDMLSATAQLLQQRQQRVGFQRNMRHQMHDQYLQALNAGRLQQQQQGSVEALSNACRLPPLWRTNHIFASSYTDECPSELIPGAWMHPGKVNGVGGMLPLTAEVQRAIYDHQNPADCSKAKFLIHSTIPSGVASIMNVETVSLLAALDSGRIMHEEYDHFLTQNWYCRGNTDQNLHNATLDSCYFEPLTRCRLTREEAAAANTFETLEQLLDPAGPRVGILGSNVVVQLRPDVPKRFAKQVEERGIPSKRRHYWWRAQAIAYIIRPNARTRAELEKRKQDRFRGEPLSPGCISLFVRGGDKAAESAVFTAQHYEGMVKRLRQIDPALTNQLFVTTEDLRTLDYFTHSSSWRTSFLYMKEEESGGRDDTEYLRSLLNLDLALQCDGYVGSFFSNWQRLIDEMRVTVRCKANAVYVDAHYKTPAEMDFNW